eukprot:5615409-Prymnesium_polylepis.1
MPLPSSLSSAKSRESCRLHRRLRLPGAWIACVAVPLRAHRRDGAHHSVATLTLAVLSGIAP